MACVFRDAGNREKAEEYFEKACAANPDCFWDFAYQYLDTDKDALFPFSPDKAETILSRWLNRGNGEECGDAFSEIARKFEEGDGVPADAARAARLYRAVAEIDVSGCAALRLGAMCEEGRGVAKDSREAARLYRIAVSRGEDAAKKRLGLLLFAGAEGVPANRSEAVELLWDAWRCGIAEAPVASQLKAHFLSLAENGDVIAQFRLSKILYKEECEGWTVGSPHLRTKCGRRKKARRYAESAAAKWARAAAEGGNAEAQFTLWQELHELFPQESFAWLKRAADSGYADALKELAWIFENGNKTLGVRKNLREAIRLYEKADAAGSKFTHEFWIGRCFMELREWARAAAALTRAFEQDYAEKNRLSENRAAFILATQFYANGRGVPKDLHMAARLLELAAESHMWEARIALGEALWRGLGVPANPERAVALFLREGDLEPFPQWRLAQAYALGRGVPSRSFREAFRWLLKCVLTFALKVLYPFLPGRARRFLSKRFFDAEFCDKCGNKL